MKTMLQILSFTILTVIVTALSDGCTNATVTSLLDVLPGEGWDAIVAEPRAKLVSRTYAKCVKTDDGHFIIPDNINSRWEKRSDIKLYADIFTHINDYTVLTAPLFDSDKVNLLGETTSIDGTYSAEFLKAKKLRVRDDAIITRVQLKARKYILEMGGEIQLHETFKSRLMEIHEHLLQRNFLHARYLVENIVQEYGTHYVKSIEVGGLLVEENFVSSNFTQRRTTKEITAAASYEFLKMLNFRINDINQSVSETLLQDYKSSRTNSEVRTFGGSPLHVNLSVDEWMASVKDNLVVIERRGDTIEKLLTPQTLPDLNTTEIETLRSQLVKVINFYYDYNTHNGCTDQNSDNFDFTANVGDGSCNSQSDFVPFGGFYQTCTTTKKELCNGLAVKNLLTNDYSCSPDYMSQLLIDPNQTVRHLGNDTISLTIYWCYPNNKGHQDISFGGAYNDIVVNPITGTRSCPHTFKAMRIGYNDTICLAVLPQVNISYISVISVISAGFFSCSEGNPRSTPYSSTQAPKNCPVGYTTHMLSYINGCFIKQCIDLKSFFADVPIPYVAPSFTDSDAVFNVDNHFTSTTTKPSSNGMNAGSVAAIVLAIILLLLIIVIVVYIVAKRRRNGSSASSEPTATSPYDTLPEAGN